VGRQDTGDAGSTKIAAGCSVLLGGWRVPRMPGAEGRVADLTSLGSGKGPEGDLTSLGPEGGAEQGLEAGGAERGAERGDGAELAGWRAFFAPEESEAALREAVGGVRLLEPAPAGGRDTEAFVGCGCAGGACGTGCACVALGRERAGTAESRAVGASLIECGAACACGPDCTNRAVQRGRRAAALAADVEVFRAGTGKGWGVRARRGIARGAFVVEYVGEALPPAAARARRAAQEARGDPTYLLVVREVCPSFPSPLFALCLAHAASMEGGPASPDASLLSVSSSLRSPPSLASCPLSHVESFTPLLSRAAQAFGASQRPERTSVDARHAGNVARCLPSRGGPTAAGHAAHRRCLRCSRFSLCGSRRRAAPAPSVVGNRSSNRRT
jgi:hypothetical protein